MTSALHAKADIKLELAKRSANDPKRSSHLDARSSKLNYKEQELIRGNGRMSLGDWAAIAEIIGALGR